MDTKLQMASDGLDEYRQALAGIQNNMETALKQYATLLCQPLREIETQYAVVIQAIRQEKEAHQASCPHQSVIETKFVFFAPVSARIAASKKARHRVDLLILLSGAVLGNSLASRRALQSPSTGANASRFLTGWEKHFCAIGNP